MCSFGENFVFARSHFVSYIYDVIMPNDFLVYFYFILKWLSNFRSSLIFSDL